LPVNTAVDIQATESIFRPFLSDKNFAGRAAVSSLKIVCRNEEYRLTGMAHFGNMPFCLGREIVVYRATQSNPELK
jgi:hypothetical protein